MMHFSTSDENFWKKLPYGCKVKVPLLNTVGISYMHPLTSDQIKKPYLSPYLVWRFLGTIGIS